MNYEQLKNAQKKWDDIAKLQKNIEILENPYVNTISGFDYSNGKDGERVFFYLDGELRDMVIDYLRKQLNNLKLEFEKM